MDNSISTPLLGCLVTALLTLLSITYPRIQRVFHYFGAVLYSLFVILIGWQLQKTGILSLRFGGYPSGIAISFVVDYFSWLMLLVTSLIILAVAVYLPKDETITNKGTFYPAFWLMNAGITGLFCTSDLFNLYVWFEVMVIASFVLMVHSSMKKRLQGAMSYIGMNLLATLILLLAISFIYGLSGTLDMPSLANWAGSHEWSYLVFVCFTLLMIAFAMKSALFPYYFWLPDSYHLTSVSAGGVFAGLLTKAGVYSLIRSATLFFPHDSNFTQLLLIVSLLTMVSGVMGAAGDFHIRRILSFHIVSQVGYMTLSLAMGSLLALSAGIFYIVHHILVKTNLFLISGVLTHLTDKVDLRQMGGFFRKKPLLAVLFAVPAFSLAGIPPFSGFWAKFLLLEAALKEGYALSAFIILFVGFFTLYSMVKIWRFVFMQPEIQQIKPNDLKRQASFYVPIIFLSGLTLLIGLYPQWLYGLAQKSASALLEPECYRNIAQGRSACRI